MKGNKTEEAEIKLYDCAKSQTTGSWYSIVEKMVSLAGTSKKYVLGEDVHETEFAYNCPSSCINPSTMFHMVANWMTPTMYD